MKPRIRHEGGNVNIGVRRHQSLQQQSANTKKEKYVLCTEVSDC